MNLRQNVERLIRINATGPVTSVALTVPTGFAVSGSPGTGAVSLGLTYSGTFPVTSMPALTGDVTSSAGSTATTISSIQGIPIAATPVGAGKILIYNGLNADYEPQSVSGDISLADSGAVTVSKINGNPLGTTTPTATNLLIADGTQWRTRTMSGDATITAVGVLTISKINGGGIWNLLSCATDQTVTNNSTLQNDATLTFLMAANTNYRIRGKIWLDGTSTTAAMKYAFSGPAAPTLVRFERWDNANGAAATGRTIDTSIPGSTTLTTGTTATGEMLRFEGIVQNGANAGTFVFQFAQATATAAQSVVRRAGSYMEWAVA